MYPNEKLTIVGGGIVGALEAYYAYKEAKADGKSIRITIYDKNSDLRQTTACNVVPSLTPDEILSVVPRGPELLEKLGILFSQPGGIRIEDVNDVNDSVVAQEFIRWAQEDSLDKDGYNARQEKLLELGKWSMELWQEFYDDADDELKKILIDSNFHPCHESTDPNVKKLYDGYRIDLIYQDPNAKQKAEQMQQAYERIGYKNCKILSPQEVTRIDPFLVDFCNRYSEENAWKKDAVAIYRPGGCIDTQSFLPKFYDYLKKIMGQYANEKGERKDCLQLRFGKEVTGVTYTPNDSSQMDGLYLKSLDNSETQKNNKHQYTKSDYVFCPGEGVGTLRKLGFNEPAYAKFAGVHLALTISLTDEQCKKYEKFNHYMEVHQEGVVLAWQAKIKQNKIYIGVAGTKAFYGDQRATITQDFARNRNLLQLNMINDVLPEFVSLALKRDTKARLLTWEDLQELETQGIAARRVGNRAVVYDGFPTLGIVYRADGKLEMKNARCTTHLGSGGVSFALSAVSVSRTTKSVADVNLKEKVLEYGSSCRAPRK